MTRVLVDTNLLIAVVQSAHAHHSVATRAVARLTADGHDLFVTPQNIYEFWTVATRPTTSNGLGLATATAQAKVRGLRQSFGLLADGPGIITAWQALVVTYDVKGKTAHDARLVAAMLVHGVDAILTFNGADSTRYTNIRVLDPAAVAAGTAP